MAARFLVKRLTAVNVSSTPGGDFSGYVLRQATTGINYFSTGYKQTEGTTHYGQGSNTANDDKSTASYVSDKAKEGVKKATDAAINAGDNMKDTMEGAWKAAKETGQNISDAVAGDDDGRIQEDKVAVELKDVQQPVDTTEYRGVEDLHQQTGGEVKSP
ncbi:hypothetical protein CARUB_v10015407mg [Capsella rubella]|uniref:Uncharacterized protein n=1 Tax=Capsella rubella TaxID=81985 RepID=R0I2L8_9BRAS|nr:uncharacterized protein LOC17892012 [Capsella rubella]EOA32155.1 hypothetical protein CARUB_v10015407mg [Capsella rubella]